MKRIIAPLIVVGVCAASAVPASGAGSVRVGDNFFSPKTERVSRGQTVTWRWVGDKRHNVRSGSFRSSTKRSGTYRHKFNRRGTFRYVCTLHDGMTGRIVVR